MEWSLGSSVGWFGGRARRFAADLAKALIEAAILASLPAKLSAKRLLVLANGAGELQETALREPALDHRIMSSCRMHVLASKMRRRSGSTRATCSGPVTLPTFQC